MNIVGSNHNDTITGSAGNDSIMGGSGNDYFYATAGSDTLNGGGGTNTLDFSNATVASTINLTTGATTGFATTRSPTSRKWWGRAMAIRLRVQQVTTASPAARGTIISMRRLGSDTLNGGGGTNTLDFSNATSASTINLTTGTTTGFATDTLSNFTHRLSDQFMVIPLRARLAMTASLVVRGMT